MCTRYVRFHEKLAYKNEYKNQNLPKNFQTITHESELISFEGHDSETEKETEQIIVLKETQKNVNQKNKSKKRISEKEIDDQYISTIRKQRKRRAKEGRDFTIYAKIAESENFKIQVLLILLPKI